MGHGYKILLDVLYEDGGTRTGFEIIDPIRLGMISLKEMILSKLESIGFVDVRLT